MAKYFLTTLIVYMALLSPLMADASFDVSLKYGMSGSAVFELQDLLVSEKCLTVSPTGYFGMLTLNAVKCFQLKYSLPNTGYFGVMSRAVANSLVVETTASSTAQEIEETGTTTVISTPFYSQGTYYTQGGYYSAPVVGSQHIVTASLGEIYKGEWQGETRNFVPVTFNDADIVQVTLYCPDADKVGSIINGGNTLKKADYPEGNAIIFRYKNVGKCTYQLKSLDSNNKSFGEDKFGEFIFQ